MEESKNQKTVYIETYGCSANQNNSEILAGILSRAGFIITNNVEIAEIIILNTCIVKGKTESKIKRRIQDLSKNKKPLIITGCMPETDAKKLKLLNKNLLLLGTHHFKDILSLIKDYQENKLDWTKQDFYLSKKDEIKLNLPKKPLNPIISIHQISEGCVGNCSYCKTRLAKGPLFSYPEQEILKSIESDLINGAKEIWLTSEDAGAYGLDIDKKSHLIELLEKILSLKHKFKLRLGMANPNNILPILHELIEIYKTNPKIFKFLHIPIQSASDSVLKHMNRFYTIKQAEKIIQEFRKEIPNITIATDIITGYPTETKKDHETNLDFIKNNRPDVLNLSKFSSHKQTEAGKLKQLGKKIISKRASEIMQIHIQTARQNKEIFLNKEIKALVEEKIADSGDLFQARDENYNKVLFKGDKSLLGKEILVQITNAGVHHLIGKVVA